MARKTVTAKKQKNLILQGGMGSVCTLICYLVPVIYSFFLSSKWGDKGNGIFAAALGIFVFCVFLCAESVVDPMSRLIRARIYQNAIKEARAMQRSVLFYCIVSSIILSVLMFFRAGAVSRFLLGNSYGEPAIIVLSWVLFFKSLIGFFRGYFITHKGERIYSASLVMEALFGLFFSIIFVKVLSGHGLKVSAVLRNSDYVTVFSVAGVAAGILAGSVFTFLILFAVYIATHGFLRKAYGKDAGRGRELGPRLLITFIVSLLIRFGCVFMAAGGIFIDQVIYKALAHGTEGYTVVSESFGIYILRYRVITLIPLIITMIMCKAPISLMARPAFEQDPKKRLRLTESTFKAVLLSMLPLSILIGAGSKLISGAIYPGLASEEFVAMLGPGFITAIFYSIAYILFSLLWEDGVRIGCLAGVAIPFSIHIILEVLFCGSLQMDITGVLFADIIFSFGLAFAAFMLAGKNSLIRTGVFKEYISFIVGSVAMWVVVFVLSLLLSRFAEGIVGLILLAVAYLIGTIVFYVIVLAFHSVTERDLALVPGGSIPAFVGRITGFI